MMEDMEIRDKIHNLEMKLKGVKKLKIPILIVLVAVHNLKKRFKLFISELI